VSDVHAVRGLLAQQRSLLLVVALFTLIAVFGGTVASPLLERIITVMLINLILVLGLQMFMGNSGYLSFAHVAFMGIGAYASALLTMPVDIKASALPQLYSPLAGIEWPFLPAVLVAAGVCFLVAAVFGFPLMRLSESAAAIASFALLVIVHVVLSQWSAVTNGPRTLFGVLRYTDLWTAATWALLVIVAAFLYKQSSLGLRLRASRDNLHAAASIGVNVFRVRFIAFVLSAFVCGVAGALWAHFITSFAPGAFYLSQTFVILTMLIVGGPRTVSGAALGVLLVTIVHEGLRHVENQFNVNATVPFEIVGMTEVLLAVALIAMLAFRPGGLIQRREIASPVAEAEPEPTAGPTK
jgi:branched-chain amino acid transport system permease protein